MTEQGYDLAEFIRGQSDCHQGLPAKQDESVSYNAGYNVEYQLEQNEGEYRGLKEAI